MKYSIFTYENYSFIELVNNNNFKVTLCTLGASIYSIYLDDKPMNLITKKLEDFIKHNYYNGKTIGRTSNRIKGHKITINDREYELKNNEGCNTLHGGIDGISSKNFIYQLYPSSTSCKIVFSYLSPDKESGYPGNLNLKVSYTLYENKDYIDIAYEGITDLDTICSLTNHTCYTLGESSALDLKLKINASDFLSTNKEDLIPIEKEEVLPCLDFRAPKRIGENIFDQYLINHRAKGYDHYFYFDNHDISTVNVTLESDRYQLNIYTSFKGTQIYSSNYKTMFEYIGTNESQYMGVAIEPSDEFLNLHILKKGEPYIRFIRLAFLHK